MRTLATRTEAQERRTPSELVSGAFAILVLVVAYSILFVPLLVLVVFSFNDSIAVTLPFEGVTTRWYQAVFRDPNVVVALRNSLVLAAIVTPIALLLGTLAAFAITRFRFRFRAPISALVAAPLVIPWLLMGVGALIFFNRLGVPLSLKTVGAMHVLVAFPLVAAILSARLLRFDKSLEEAALDLGAKQREVLRYILLPALWPALAASAILAFSWSFNNFTISFFTGGLEITFPIWVFSTLQHAQNVPVVNAISTIVSAVQVLAVYLAWRLLRSRSGTANGGIPGLGA